MGTVNMSVLFSIIVPIYGVEAFLPQCIESVLAQSCHSWELILVDDGSPDRCGEICDRYASQDERIQVIHKENGGLVSARQAGSAKARGEYILNLDSDDFWEDDTLSQLETVISQYHPDCISFGFRKFLDNGQKVGEYPPFLPERLYCGADTETLKQKLLFDIHNPRLNVGSFSFAVWLMAVRRDIVVPCQEKVPKEIKVGEDAAVTIPALCRCERIYVLDKILYNYRIRHGSVSRKFSASEAEETKRLIAYLRQHTAGIPAENFFGLWYRMMDNYLVKAAKGCADFKTFRAVASDAWNDLPKDVVCTISALPLRANYRLRFLTEKYGLWPVFWLIYHRR